MKAGKLFVVADDITGAADCISHTAFLGREARIYRNAAPSELPPGISALSTDSRHVTPEHSAERVESALRALKPEADTVVFKKIDSLLRGNVAEEVEAFRRHFGSGSSMLLSSALPVYSRVIRGGYLEAEQISPKSLYVPEFLSSRGVLGLTTIPLETVRGSSEVLCQVFAAAWEAPRTFVPDSLTDEDLLSVVNAAKDSGANLLFAGSAGLLRALSRVMFEQIPENQRASRATELKSDRVLFALGSGTNASHRQIARLASAGKIEPVLLSPYSESPPRRDFNRDTLLFLPQPDIACEDEAARNVAVRFSRAVYAVADRLQPETVVLTGGWTAECVFERFGIRELSFIRDVQPGMPLLGATDRSGIYRQYILKSGSHGDEGSLLRMYDELKRFD